mmetsp:Transcript_20693/g.26755  ORF Transcript_20693/g.26755 Transcript_20693/m.26755 type:complete len:91 (+) Transcript_20693:260-532(+)|eukprot:CAMPEP_0116067094 /NCGR_PEP_ID=MMETSP0322-20121206/10793_1 /TAXON_ID=163516 /ORGANISM="Leptocylindrus danicus var. apora, Strain B651" /LENGTH=90 /DNA_ID=CAMNT_0003553813 /DNA_START=164 /DNA_END=436 /DNA_ORIENTATION=-
METVEIKVLLFATAREAAGNVSSVFCKLETPADTQKLRSQLAHEYPKMRDMVLDEDSMTLALNEEYIPPGETLPLKSGDVVALIPPISGG